MTYPTYDTHTGFPLNQPSPRNWRTCLFLLAGVLIMLAILVPMCLGAEWSDDQIADAIYLAEGGAISHPYGILAHYEHTTPRQACINTIRHARRDYDGTGDFIAFLGSRYCPVGAANDPRRLNKNWLRNVTWWLKNGKKRIQ